MYDLSTDQHAPPRARCSAHGGAAGPWPCGCRVAPNRCALDVATSDRGPVLSAPWRCACPPWPSGGGALERWRERGHGPEARALAPRSWDRSVRPRAPRYTQARHEATASPPPTRARVRRSPQPARKPLRPSSPPRRSTRSRPGGRPVRDSAGYQPVRRVRSS